MLPSPLASPDHRPPTTTTPRSPRPPAPAPWRPGTWTRPRRTSGCPTSRSRRQSRSTLYQPLVILAHPAMGGHRVGLHVLSFHLDEVPLPVVQPGPCWAQLQAHHPRANYMHTNPTHPTPRPPTHPQAAAQQALLPGGAAAAGGPVVEAGRGQVGGGPQA